MGDGSVPFSIGGLGPSSDDPPKPPISEKKLLSRLKRLSDQVAQRGMGISAESVLVRLKLFTFLMSTSYQRLLDIVASGEVICPSVLDNAHDLLTSSQRHNQLLHILAVR